jgi:hypothetical protein
MECICSDCGADTTPCTRKRGCRHKGRWEFYMAHHRLWRAAGAGKGFLCIGCLELRLGRKLTARDFTCALINDPHPWDTPRLNERKGLDRQNLKLKEAA